MKLAAAALVTRRPSPATERAVRFLRRRRKDEVFDYRELADAIRVTHGHAQKALAYDPAVAPFTRVVRNRRWFGRPEALDALERMT
jgi:hypothetical protein